MTINWKQGLFAAAILLSASLLFVGCGKCKTDKAVADKSTGEIVGEEIDVIEVVPDQTPNEAPNDAKDQKSTEPTLPAPSNNDAPAMTPPSAAAPTPDAPTNQTPEPTTNPDAAPSSTTSDVTVSTSCSATTSEQSAASNWESEPVIESESAYCCNYSQPESACSPACSPAMEACQPACDAAVCAPEPVCNPPICCPPVPACVPVCRPFCTPCRCQPLRFLWVPFFSCCRMSAPCFSASSPCSAACEPACDSSACEPACQSIDSSGNSASSWTNDSGAPTENSQPQNNANKSRGLPDPKINEGAQRAKPSTAVGSAPTTPESPSIVLPEAK